MKLIFFVGICAWAQVDQPRIGVMLDLSGTARPVLGVAASVTLSDPQASGIVSMACARKCVTRTDAAIIALDGDSVYVYASGRLTKDDQPVDVNVTGEILSMRAVDGALEFAVRRDDGVWIVRDGNAVVSAIPEATGAVMLIRDGALFAEGDETVLRRLDGSEIRFPVHTDSFIAMGEGYVQIRSDAASYALRLAPGREKLFQLPEVQ